MGIKRRLTGIRLDKIAAVDRPCQQHATVAIIKRAPPGEVPPAIAKKTFQEALHAQLVSEKISDTFWRAFENQYAVREAFRTALTDDVSEGGDGTEAITGFTEAMQQIASLAAEAAREAAKTDDATLEAAVESAVSKWLQQEKPTMFKFTTKAALQAAIAKFAPATSTVQDSIDITDSATALGAEGLALLPADGPLAKAAPVASPEVTALQREVAVLKMAEPIRKHYDGLDANGQTAFLALDDTARATAVEKANATDPVLYTCKDGTEVRKSDGAFAVTMAKRMDSLEGENAVLKGQVGEDSIKKRALEFTNLPNAESIVKAADLMPEADRTGYLDAMRAANKAAGGRFVRVGNAGGGTSIEKGADDPQNRMDAIVKKFRDVDPALSEAAAVVKAAATTEYQEAYRDSVAHQLPTEAQ
jgi:hypothetical protein